MNEVHDMLTEQARRLGFGAAAVVEFRPAGGVFFLRNGDRVPPELSGFEAEVGRDGLPLGVDVVGSLMALIAGTPFLVVDDKAEPHAQALAVLALRDLDVSQALHQLFAAIELLSLEMLTMHSPEQVKQMYHAMINKMFVGVFSAPGSLIH